MKKVRGILLVILLALTVISMYSVAGTYAKYTSTGSATGSAKIAVWDVRFTNDKKIWEDGTTIDLFSGDVYELTSTDRVSTTTEEHVTGYCSDSNITTKTACTGDEHWTMYIAPGTGGYITAPKIKNNSDVELSYVTNIELPSTGNPDINIEFSLDQATWYNKTGFNNGVSIINTISDLNNQLKTNNKITLKPGETSTDAQIETQKIYWRWKFNENTTADTNDTTTGQGTVDGSGNITRSEFKVNVKVIATQED